MRHDVKIHYHRRFYYQLPPEPSFGVVADEETEDNSAQQAPSFGEDSDQQQSSINQKREELKERIKQKAQEKYIDPIKQRAKEKANEALGRKGAQEATKQSAEKLAQKAATQVGEKVLETGVKAAATTGVKAAAGATVEAAAGPIGWVLAAGTIIYAAVNSKTVQRILPWIAIALAALIFLLFALAVALFRQSNGPGPKLGGGGAVTPIQNKSLPAEAARDKGQLVTTSLDTVDQAIKGAQAVLDKNPSITGASRIRDLLNQLKGLRQDTESKTFADSNEEATQLRQYRQILNDLALALDPDAAAKQQSLLDRLKSNNGITITQTGGCAPERDIQNMTLTSKLFDAIGTVADTAKANSITANLTCLVTGYRDILGGNNHDYPMCGVIDGETAVLTERQSDIAAHCNGRGADFGGDYQPLYKALQAKASDLKFTILDAKDHLHIEVQP